MKVLKFFGKVLAYFGLFLLAVGLGFATKLVVSQDNSMKVEWNESVGTAHIDISYGDGELNKSTCMCHRINRSKIMG